MENIKTILSGANSTYLLALLEQYHHDPESVPMDWRPVLSELATEYGVFEKRPNWGRQIDSQFDEHNQTESSAGKAIPEAPVNSQTGLYDIQLHTKVFQLIHAYRSLGHLQANLDPLNMEQPVDVPELNPSYYHFSDMDYNKSVYVGGAFGAQSLLLSELLTRLKQTYCGVLAAEYMHIQNPDEREFFQNQIEQNTYKCGIDDKKHLLQALLKAELGEQFLHKKFPGTKRFGLDGGESLIPALNKMISVSVGQGVDTVVMGMAHRGRLATLAGVLQKPLSHILSGFLGKNVSQDALSGDVKYHLGYSSLQDINDQTIQLVLLPNPSHLEAVNTVVLGHVYRLQKEKADTNKTKV
ncbi:MAG: 2-oxoglutarate dehydrogenase E1 component, partial [Alphaproteobacteria bacterium]|nr:2-oxoglutarate dehydrogenase E1 component [Alphaproteobacteria bacterium]